MIKPNLSTVEISLISTAFSIIDSNNLSNTTPFWRYDTLVNMSSSYAVM